MSEALPKGTKRAAAAAEFHQKEILAGKGNSKIKSAKPGDEAVLIGRQGKQEITAHQLANWAGTLPLEVLTAIAYRVPRVYRGGQAA